MIPNKFHWSHRCANNEKKNEKKIALVLAHTYWHKSVNKDAKLVVYVIISIDKKTMSAKHESKPKEMYDTGKLLIQRKSVNVRHTTHK